MNPEDSLDHRSLLTEVAEAGDFATFRDRRAARASMIIDAYADRERSPIGTSLLGSYDEQCVILYTETLPLLVSMAIESDRYRDLWADEDAQLTESEAMLAAGVVTVDEHRDIDLAVVTIPEKADSLGGHRFAGMSFESIHPMRSTIRLGASACW